MLEELGAGNAAPITVFGISMSLRYLGALGLGASVLLLFAYRQLNSPSYDLDPEQRRIFATLMPADIGGGRAFFRAYAFYALTLLFSFFVLSVALPLVPGSSELFGFNQFGYSFTSPDFDEATIPLIVSLAMVGLGPAIPILRSIEETFRRMAHRLVGIPDNILDIAQRIGNVELDRARARALPAEQSAFSEGEAVCADTPVSGTPLDKELQDLMIRIRLSRAWLFSYVFSNRWPPQSIRNRFSHYFSTLQAEMEDVLRFAEAARAEARGQVGQDRASDPASVDPDLRGLASRYMDTRWHDVRDRAEAAWVGASTVLALYAVNAENTENIRSDLLRSTIAAAHASRQRPILDIVARAVLTAAFAVFSVTLVSAYHGTIATGTSEELTLAPISTALTFTLGALSIYVPSSFVAWLHRGNKVRRQRWIRAGTARAGFPTIQYVGMFVLSYAASFITLNLFSIMSRYLIAMDKTTVLTEFVYSDEVYSTSAWALLGGLQGCFLSLWQDLTESGKGMSRMSALLLGLTQGLGFGFVALVGELVQGRTFSGSLFNIGFSFFVGFLLGFLMVNGFGRYRQRLDAAARKGTE